MTPSLEDVVPSSILVARETRTDFLADKNVSKSAAVGESWVMSVHFRLSRGHVERACAASSLILLSGNVSLSSMAVAEATETTSKPSRPVSRDVGVVAGAEGEGTGACFHQVI
ncbi:uncharacterized protein LOC134269175 [Saccostrea cucullata]|uniref:uncharacterized protein LOC134269175 n=1 Tax=Saccostrea cuccullata TaxID=36930 RepID=UPI002ED3569F